MGKTFFILPLFLFSFYESSIVEPSELTLATGKTAMALVISKVKDAFEKETGIKVKFSDKDGKGVPATQVFTDVDQGGADAGFNAVGFIEWLELMRSKKYQFKNLSGIKHKIVGRNKLAILVHPEGPNELTLDQIRGIFTGKITNFKEVGGKEQTIRVVIDSRSPGSQANFVKAVLRGEPIVQNEMRITIPDDAKLNEFQNKISTTPGAIGYESSFLAEKIVKIPKHDLLGQPIVVIWSGEMKPELKKFIEFIEKKGKDLGVDLP